MKYAIDFEQNRIHHVVAEQFEVGISDQMRDVSAAATEEIVETYHLVAVVNQAIAQVRSDESCASCNQYSQTPPPGWLTSVAANYRQHCVCYVVRLLIGHSCVDGQRKTAAEDFLGHRKISASVTILTLVEVHRVKRNAMNRSADPAFTKRFHKLVAANLELFELEPQNIEMPGVFDTRLDIGNLQRLL